MAVDKALNQAPLGLDSTLAAGVVPGVNMEPELEIEIAALSNFNSIGNRLGVITEKPLHFRLGAEVYLMRCHLHALFVFHRLAGIDAKQHLMSAGVLRI